MTQIAQILASYGSYHRDRRNKICHIIGVPLIVYSLLVALAWLKFELFGTATNGAVLFLLLVVLAYMRLDVGIALVVALFSLPLLYLGTEASNLPFSTSFIVFLVAFVGGWIIQLIGHRFEGNKPALLDNLLQIFSAPLFLAAEFLFKLGLRKDLLEETQVRG